MNQKHEMDRFLQIIAQHTHFAYTAIFLVSFSESLAFVGLVVPGTVIMFGVGAIVAMGSISLKPTVLVAILGAILGDGLSYWIGHHYQDRLRSVWPFSRYPDIILRGEKFFRKHGGKSILLGRFIGPIRPVIPLVAGMMGMSMLVFTGVNVLSAIGWALAYILPGVLIGTSLAIAKTVSTRLVVLIGIIAVTTFLCFWLCRKIFQVVERFNVIFFDSLRSWTASDASKNRLKVFLKSRLSSFLEAYRGQEGFLFFTVFSLVLGTWGFLGILHDVIMKNALVRADHSIYEFFLSLRNPLADRVLIIFTELGDVTVNLAIGTSVFIFLLLKRAYRTATCWFMALIGAFLLTDVSKSLIRLPRPITIYHGVSAWGFPSGHALQSIVIYGTLAFFLSDVSRGITHRNRWLLFLQWFPFGFAFVFSSLVSLSRLYLGAHWLSDVLGGLFLGWVWTALIALGYLKTKDSANPKKTLTIVVLATLAVFGVWHVVRQQKADILVYAPKRAFRKISLNGWLAGGWESIPSYRIDIKGNRKQPLTMQFVGSPDSLYNSLLRSKWLPARRITSKEFLKVLYPHVTLGDLPLFPRLHDGRFERILVFRNGSTSRIVFRLWPTSYQVYSGGNRLWIGTVEEQKILRVSSWITLAQDTGDYNEAMRTLISSLDHEFMIKRVHRRLKHSKTTEKNLERIKWDGTVLLLLEQTRREEG